MHAMLRLRLLAVVLLLPVSGCGPRHALSGGLAQAKLHVGGGTTTRLTPIVGARLGFPGPALGARGALIADLQPVPVPNPVRNESMSTLYLLPSIAFRAGPVVVAGGAGPSMAFWSGLDPVGPLSLGAVAGASLSLDLARHANRGWGVELFARDGGGDEFSATLVGVQVFRYLK